MVQPSSSNVYMNKSNNNDPTTAAVSTNVRAGNNEHLKPRHIDKQSLDYIVRSGIAGGIAGCTGKTLIAPLDRVKILFQTSNPQFVKYSSSWLGFYTAGRAIVASEGISGLFKGHSATLLRIFPYAAIKFVAYEQIRYILIPNDNYETSVRRALSGSLSGMISVCITYPLDLIRVRLAFDTTQGRIEGRLIRLVKQVVLETPGGKGNTSSSGTSRTSIGTSSTGMATTTATTGINGASTSLKASSLNAYISGISNFYRGFLPTMVGMVPYAGVSFWAHDVFHDIFRSRALAKYAVMPDEETGGINSISPSKSHRSREDRPQLKAWAQLCAGGVAGMCAQTASYPFEVIRRRMQVSGAVGDGSRTTIYQTFKQILSTRGVQGFFVGLSIGYIKIFPMFACSFFVYERMKVVVGI